MTETSIEETSKNLMENQKNIEECSLLFKN